MCAFEVAYMYIDMSSHAHTHTHALTTTSRTIAGGDRCELEEKKGEGRIRTHDTEKPDDL